MDLVKYFERKLQECEEALRYAQATPGFRLCQRTTDGGEQDITAQHIQDLRVARDEYQNILVSLKDE